MELTLVVLSIWCLYLSIKVFRLQKTVDWFEQNWFDTSEYRTIIKMINQKNES